MSQFPTADRTLCEVVASDNGLTMASHSQRSRDGLGSVGCNRWSGSSGTQVMRRRHDSKLNDGRGEFLAAAPRKTWLLVSLQGLLSSAVLAPGTGCSGDLRRRRAVASR